MINPTPSVTPIYVNENACDSFKPVVNNNFGSLTDLSIYVRDEFYARKYPDGDLKIHVDYGDGERVVQRNLKSNGKDFEDVLLHDYKEPGFYNANLIVDNEKNLMRSCANVDVYIGKPVPPKCSELHIQSNATNLSTEIKDESENNYSAYNVGQIIHNSLDGIGGGPIYGTTSLSNDGPGGVIFTDTKDKFGFINEIKKVQWSIELWVKPQEIKEANTFITNRNTIEGLGFDFGLYNNDLKFIVNNALEDDSVELSYTENWVTGDWYHVAVVSSNNALRLYVNGLEKDNLSTTNYDDLNFTQSQSDIHIGFKNKEQYSDQYLIDGTPDNFIQNPSLENLNEWKDTGEEATEFAEDGVVIIQNKNKIEQEIKLIAGKEYELAFQVRNADTTQQNGSNKGIQYDLLGTIISKSENTASNGDWTEIVRFSFNPTDIDPGNFHDTKIAFYTKDPNIGSYYAELLFISVNQVNELDAESLNLSDYSNFQFQDIKITQRSNYFLGEFYPPTELIPINCQDELAICPELHIQSDVEDQDDNFKDSGQYNYGINNYKGSPIHSSAVTKFGQSSLYLNSNSTLEVLNKFNFIHNALDQTWTIQLWFYIKEVSEIQELISNTTSNTHGFKIYYNNVNESINFELISSETKLIRLSSSTTDTKIKEKTWHHCVVTYNVLDYSLYLDGSIVSTSEAVSNNGVQLAEHNLLIGNGFNGYMQDIMVSKGNIGVDTLPPIDLINKNCEVPDKQPTLCPDLHIQSNNAESDIAVKNLGIKQRIKVFTQGSAYHSREAVLFNQSSLLVNDLSENENSYVYARQQTEFKQSYFGGRFYFHYNHNKSNLNDLFIPTHSITFAVETWVRFTDLSKHHTIFYQTDDNETAFTELNRITHNDNPDYFSFITYKDKTLLPTSVTGPFGGQKVYNYDYHEFQSNQKIEVNKWYHLALVKIGNTNTIKLYINGEEASGQGVDANHPNIFLPADYDLEERNRLLGFPDNTQDKRLTWMDPNVVLGDDFSNPDTHNYPQRLFDYFTNNPAQNLVERNSYSGNIKHFGYYLGGVVGEEFNINLNIGRHRNRHSKDLFSDQKFYVQDFRVHTNTSYDETNIIIDQLSNSDDCGFCPAFAMQSKIELIKNPQLINTTFTPNGPAVEFGSPANLFDFNMTTEWSALGNSGTHEPIFEVIFDVPITNAKTAIWIFNIDQRSGDRIFSVRNSDTGKWESMAGPMGIGQKIANFNIENNFPINGIRTQYSGETSEAINFRNYEIRLEDESGDLINLYDPMLDLGIGDVANINLVEGLVQHDASNPIINNSSFKFTRGALIVNDFNLQFNSIYQLNFWMNSSPLTFADGETLFKGFGKLISNSVE